MQGLPADALSLEVHRGAAGLAEIAPLWRALSGTCRRAAFCHCPEWYEAYLAWMSPAPEEVCFCVLRRGQRPVAVVPLERQVASWMGLGCRTLRFPQDTVHMPAGDFTCADDVRGGEVARALLWHCGQTGILGWDRLLLDRVAADSVVAPALAEQSGYRWQGRLAGYRCQVALRPIDEILAGLAPKTRKALRNTRHRLDRMGRVTFETANQRESLSRALAEFIDLEASGWKGRAGSAIRCSARLSGFYRMLAERFANRGACDIHTLRLDGRPVAGLFALRAGDTAFFLKVGYDESMAAAGPGHHLSAYALRHYYEATPIRRVNLLSDFEYLHMWNPERCPVLDLAVFDNSTMGIAARQAYTAARAVRHAYGVTLEGVVRRAARRLARYRRTATAAAGPALDANHATPLWAADAAGTLER